MVDPLAKVCFKTSCSWVIFFQPAAITISSASSKLKRVGGLLVGFLKNECFYSISWVSPSSWHQKVQQAEIQWPRDERKREEFVVERMKKRRSSFWMKKTREERVGNSGSQRIPSFFFFLLSSPMSLSPPCLFLLLLLVVTVAAWIPATSAATSCTFYRNGQFQGSSSFWLNPGPSIHPSIHPFISFSFSFSFSLWGGDTTQEGRLRWIWMTRPMSSSSKDPCPRLPRCLG